MPSRHQDWLRQGRRDLEHARHSRAQGDYEWACFAAQQGAEKAVEAVFQKLGAEAWGHSVSELLAQVSSRVEVPPELLDQAKELDAHYISTRYPNAYPQGSPGDYYTRAQAERAVEQSDAVIRFCEGLLLR